jgi:hypothetical protein
LGDVADVLAILVSGTLLCAGVAKLAVPGPAARAIGDLLPRVAGRAVVAARTLAVVETATSLMLLLPAARIASVVAGVLLGLLFAGAGAVAAARGLGAPCGCFGRPVGRPLGLRNVLLGVLLAAACALVAAVGLGAATVALPVLGTATVALLLTGWLYRDMIGDLLPASGRASEARSGS